MRPGDSSSQGLNRPRVEISSVNRLRGVFTAWAGSESGTTAAAAGTLGEDPSWLGPCELIRPDGLSWGGPTSRGAVPSRPPFSPHWAPFHSADVGFCGPAKDALELACADKSC